MKRLAVVAFSILIAGAAIAQPRGPHGGPPDSRALGAYLSLTAEQAAAWDAIQSERRDTFVALHQRERALREQVDEAGDAAEIGKLVLELRAVQTKIDIARDSAAAKFAEILTSEQQVKFAAFQQATEFLQRRGPAGPPPPPRSR
jgi:Spy/CpxP family protein refolding chaperone